MHRPQKSTVAWDLSNAHIILDLCCCSYLITVNMFCQKTNAHYSVCSIVVVHSYLHSTPNCSLSDCNCLVPGFRRHWHLKSEPVYNPKLIMLLIIPWILPSSVSQALLYTIPDLFMTANHLLAPSKCCVLSATCFHSFIREQFHIEKQRGSLLFYGPTITSGNLFWFPKGTL